MTDWLIWQLADSAFPIGGFAHSGGLESAWRAGEITDEQSLVSYLEAGLLQCAQATAPLALWAYRQPQCLAEADALCDLVLNHPIPNRASRAQGRGLLGAARRIYPPEKIVLLGQQSANAGRPGHFAPVFGVLCRCLEIEQSRVAALFLFINLRGCISAAVRLGVVGPMAAQAMQFQLTPRAEQLARAAEDIEPDNVAQPAPVAELLQACQDRLYSRLFQT